MWETAPAWCTGDKAHSARRRGEDQKNYQPIATDPFWSGRAAARALFPKELLNGQKKDSLCGSPVLGRLQVNKNSGFCPRVVVQQRPQEVRLRSWKDCTPFTFFQNSKY